MRFTEVNDPHYAFIMLHKVRQIKNGSVQVYTETLYALANDVFVKVDKAVVESQLVGLHEGHERKPKNISGCSMICIGRTKFEKEISTKVK